MSYKVPKGEENSVHVKVQKKEFDSKTGKALFKPFTFKCTPDEYKQFLKHPGGLEVIEELHIPQTKKTNTRKKTTKSASNQTESEN